MTNKINVPLMVIAFASSSFFLSCNNNKVETKTVTKDSAATAHESSEHIYACPMHPEVTGKEGDTCPKFSMIPPSDFFNYFFCGYAQFLT